MSRHLLTPLLQVGEVSCFGYREGFRALFGACGSLMQVRGDPKKTIGDKAVGLVVVLLAMVNLSVFD